MNEKELDEKTTEKFIDEQINDLKETINYIEKERKITLTGDRTSLQDVKKDLINLTNAQVLYFFSIWKNNLYKMFL